MKILLVDDHAVVRRGLVQMLADEFKGAEFGEASDAEEALRMIEAGEWNLAIIDVNMPGRNGIELIKDIRLIKPVFSILVLSMHQEDQIAVRTLKAGADGYISKQADSLDMLKAIHKILKGEKYVSSSLAQHLVKSLGPSPKEPHELLSDREFQILGLIAKGKSLKDIGGELGLNVKTVSTYRARILGKMKVESNADLTRYALQHHLIS